MNTRKRNIGTAEAALTNTTEIKVRFSEVDSMKIVWHGEYVRYFEDGREAFGRQYEGVGYLDFYENGYTAPIVNLQVQYLIPLTINDIAIIETRYIETQAAKFCLEYIVKRKNDNEVVARGCSTQVFLDQNGEMCLNNPPFFEAWKKRWLKK